MATTDTFRTILKGLMILITTGWVCLWLLKPTELWAKSWSKAEDSVHDTVFGYYGLNFVVYTLPIIAVAIIGFIYLHLHGNQPRNRQMRRSITNLSNPIIVHSRLGIISGSELLAATLFIIFLVWTIYAHISNDFKKIKPVKPLNMNTWQYKSMKIGTRLGLLSEACLALLLLPVLRGMSLFRLIGLQFEASVRYHVCLGTMMIFFSTFHGLIILSIWAMKNRLEDEIWRWQRTGRIYLAGEIGFVIGLVIWITSLPQIRRKRFEIFYYTHHLYTVFFIFFLFHVGDRHFYMVFSGVLLFALDKILRIIQSRPPIHVVSARIFPSKAIELTLSKHPRLKYSPTSVIYLRVPSISKFQWHPFSITSGPSVDDERISVIIKGEGSWTNSLYNTILASMDSDARQEKCLPVSVEGPYGPVSMDFLRYESLLLIAGGIGISPFLSILQEIAYTRSRNKNKLPTRIQLIYVVKKSQDISLLNPISHIFLNHSEDQPSIKVKIFVTQEDRSARTVRELLNDQSQVRIINFDTKGLNYTTYGLESLPWMAAITGFSSIVFLLSLMCLNNTFLHSERKDSEKKHPSWVTDLLLMCSFVIATTFGMLIMAIMRWRKLKEDIPRGYFKPIEGTEPRYSEAKGTVEEPDIHYGERPNFQDIFSKFPIQTVGSDVGVLVCGPESMKESVALLCRQNSQGFTIGTKKRKPYFSFHSLNFAL